MKTQRLAAFLIAGVAAALLLTACRAGETGAQGTAQEATTAQPETTGAAETVGATGDEATSGETYYWISQFATLPLFVENDHVGLNAAAAELGVDVEIAGPTNIDLPAFIAAIEQVCAQKPAGVMVVGWDPSLAAPIDKCIEQGVPTVTDDGDVPDSDRLAFVGTDWYQIGVAQAEAMIEATGGTGQVATTSIINADTMKLAIRGFKDTLEGTDIEVVADEDDGGDRSKAARVTASLLAAYPDLAGIAGFDAESGPGIVQALTEAGKLGDVKVTSMETSEPEFFQTIEDGSVAAIIVQKRALFTYYALKLLYGFNHNGLSVLGLQPDQAPPIPSYVDTGLVVVTRDNVADVLANAGKSPEERIAPGAPAATSGETYYWISQFSTLPLFVDNDYKGLDAAEQQLGVEVEVAGPTNVDLPAFISAIEQVCAQKPAGVTVVGWDPSLAAPMDNCLAQGVPTVADDGDVPDSDRLSFVGTDWYQIGVAQAEAMIEATGGTGQVATTSIINADTMKLAIRGFKDTLEGTDIEVVADEDDGGDRSKAAQVTASLLAAYPDLAGIAGFDAESGPGIVQALTEAGKLGDVKVTSMETSEPEFFQTIEDGSVAAIIVQKRELFTYYAIDLLYDYNHNGLSVLGLSREQAPPIPSRVDTGLLVVNAGNVDAVLASLGL